LSNIEKHTPKKIPLPPDEIMDVLPIHIFCIFDDHVGFLPIIILQATTIHLQPMSDTLCRCISCLLHKKKGEEVQERAEIYRGNSPCSSPKIRRRRKSVEEIYEQLGPTSFKRAYRMSYESFFKLVEKITPYLPQSDACM
jgi:hypothetical protein